MSLNIWTECGGRSNAGPLQLEPWRLVESQYVTSTRKLVDSNAEQELLEQLIDTAKPKLPPDVRRLHYLLSTPFRHPPLKNGSRFGVRSERGLFYGSKELPTCLAEVAYYRFVFLAGTTAALPPLSTQHTAFQVEVQTDAGVDLTRPPFSAHAAMLASPTAYAATQRLGAQLRQEGIAVALYTSARARKGGTNVAVFDPGAFHSPNPFGEQEWLCATDAEKVEFKRKNLFVSDAFTFPRTDFLVDGTLPAPAIS